MEQIVIWLLLPLVGATVTRHQFGRWQVWAGFGLVSLVGFVGIWQGCGIDPAQAGGYVLVACFIGAAGREIFQGLVGGLRSFLQRHFGIFLGVGLFCLAPLVMGVDKAAETMATVIVVWLFWTMLRPSSLKKRR